MAAGVVGQPCNPLQPANDAVQTVLAGVYQATAIAAAGYSIAVALDMGEREYLLAKKYHQIAKWWLEHYRNNYVNTENVEAAEALAIEKDTAYYDTARGRARTIAWLQYRGRVQNAVRCTSRYCTGLRQDMLTDLSIAQADAVAMTDGMGYRNERAYLEARDDVRFKKVLNTIHRGRDMVADNVSLAGAASNIYGDTFNQAWQGLTAAGQYLGYSNNRRDTRYPMGPRPSIGNNPPADYTAGDVTPTYDEGAVDSWSEHGINPPPKD